MPWPKQRTYLGRPEPRVEAPEKVTGRAKFTSDIVRPGMLYGAIFRSPLPSARIEAIDLSGARKAPGIRVALPIGDCPLRVRYYGEELGAIAGTSPQAVEDALKLIRIKAKSLPFSVDEVRAAEADSARVFDERPNFAEARTHEAGSVDEAFGGAAATVEGAYSTPVVLHQCMEPHGIVVAWGHEVTAWASTQGIFSVLDDLASRFGLPHNKVRVLCEHMGGGFGSKVGLGVEGFLCARLSREAGAPVALLLTRFEEALSVGNRPSTFQRIKLGARADGRLAAFELRAHGTPGFAAGAATAAGGGGAEIPAPYLYPAPAIRVSQANVAINAGSSRAMRAPGHPPASFGMESIMDELAVKMGIDPVEFRLRNDPSEIRRGEFRLGAEKFQWSRKYRKPGSHPGPVKAGVGCAGAMWGGGGRRAEAEVRINPDGTVEVRCGTQDLGTGSRTVAQRVAAEILRLDPSKILPTIGDTRLPPNGTSGGSTTTANICPAVYDACEGALARLAEASGIADPKGPRWLEACGKLDGRGLTAHGAWHPGLSSHGVGGVQFAEVEVDTGTGFVRVARILCVQDCGLVVNPLTCRSQVNGGIIMGIGYALYERRVMDPTSGVVLNPNFETYKLPGAADIPEIEVVFVDMPERGVIGVGEPVTIPTAAAIANAVANALGVRVRDLPMTPDKVLAALGASAGDSG